MLLGPCGPPLFLQCLLPLLSGPCADLCSAHVWTTLPPPLLRGVTMEEKQVTKRKWAGTLFVPTHMNGSLSGPLRNHRTTILLTNRFRIQPQTFVPAVSTSSISASFIIDTWDGST
ncbi:hypothetical protein Poly59_39170 [Rubripirellula reticaptiva]|uniref:Uncharacterized protein n=1 Tax=Rubripirellula reticaptiva TaxID=2528013 RepID=A0A5C6EHP5_9BACT|nr:hypothetical protein Poly59_39170 [Rubripirellula reticaptiva]